MLHAICSIEWLFCIDHWTKVSPLSMKWTAIYRDNWIKSHVSPFKHLVCHDLIYISIHHMKIISFCFVSLFSPAQENEKRKNHHRNYYEMQPPHWRNAQAVWMILMTGWFRLSVKIGTMTAFGAPCVMTNCHTGTLRRMDYYFVEMIIYNDSEKHANNVRL